jgi:hypothetical protein
VTTSAPIRQGLKPFSFQAFYGTVETVPHKDFLVATQALQPVAISSFSVQIQQAEAYAIRRSRGGCKINTTSLN